MTLQEHIARTIAKQMEPKMRRRYPEPFWHNADMFSSYFYGEYMQAAEATIQSYRQWHKDAEERL